MQCSSLHCGRDTTDHVHFVHLFLQKIARMSWHAELTQQRGAHRLDYTAHRLDQCESRLTFSKWSQVAVLIALCWMSGSVLCSSVHCGQKTTGHVLYLFTADCMNVLGVVRDANFPLNHNHHHPVCSLTPRMLVQQQQVYTISQISWGFLVALCL